MNKKSKLFLVVTLLMITMMIGAAAAADDNNATQSTTSSHAADSIPTDTITTASQSSNIVSVEDVSKNTKSNTQNKEIKTQKNVKKQVTKTATDYQSLKSAWDEIQSADDENEAQYTINLKNGEYTFEDVLETKSGSYNKTVTINGEDLDKTIFNGQNKTRFFYLSDNQQTIQLNKITFMNGYHQTKGGAIYNARSNLEVNNTKFINNNVVGGSSDDTYGGAIYADSTTSFNNTIFENNVVYTASNRYNYYAFGAAIYYGGSSDIYKLDINNCEFINNHAYSENKESTQSSLGGAVHVRGNSNFTCTNTNFMGNEANVGGAIYIYYLKEENPQVVRNCVFDSNRVLVEAQNIYLGASADKGDVDVNYYADNSNKSGIKVLVNNKVPTKTVNQKQSQVELKLVEDSKYAYKDVTSVGHNYDFNITTTDPTLISGDMKLSADNGYKLTLDTSKLPANHDDIVVFVNNVELTQIVWDYTQVEFNNITAKAGSNVVISATFRTSDNLDIPRGRVVFKLNNKTIGNANIEFAKATLNYTIPDNFSAKNYTLTAVYGGNAQFMPVRADANLELLKQDTKTTIDTEITDDNNLKITTKTLDENDNTVNKGKVAIKINGKTVTTQQTKDGIVVYNFKLTKSWNNKNMTITVIYGENSNYHTSNATITEKITLKTMKAAANKNLKSDATVNNIYVDAENGLDTNDGTQANPFKTIAKAIEAVNATKIPTNIYLTGTFKGVGNTNLTVPGNLTINFIGLGDAAIDGEVNYTYREGGSVWGGSAIWNSYLNGKGNWFMNITGGNGLITVENFTIKNCWSPGGNSIAAYPTATIDNYGNLKVNNMNFIFNHAGVGAGVRNNKDATVTIENSYFEGNRKSSSTGNFGAGLYNNGTAVVKNCTFQGNYARWGTVTNDKILNITNCTFKDNIGYDAGSTFKSGCGISINTGGADFYNIGDIYDIQTNIKNCSFINNDQMDIYADLGHVNITGNVFDHSTGIGVPQPRSVKGEVNYTIANNTFISPIPSSIYQSLLTNATPRLAIKVYGNYNYLIENNTVEDMIGNGSIAIEAHTNNSIIRNNNVNRKILVDGVNNTVVDNNVMTTLDTYAIDIKGSNNIITRNYMKTPTLKGDKAVNYTDETNMVEGNLPELKTIIIDNDNYNTYFDANGNLKAEYADIEKLVLSQLTNKTIIVDREMMITQTANVIENITIKTVTGAKLEAKFLNISNTNEKPAFILNSTDNRIDSTNITANTNAIEVYNASLFRLNYTNINVNSEDDVSAILIINSTFDNQSYIKFNNITTTGPAGYVNWAVGYATVNSMSLYQTTGMTITNNNIITNYNTFTGEYDTIYSINMVSDKFENVANHIANNNIITNGHNYAYGINTINQTVDVHDNVVVSDALTASGIQVANSQGTIENNTVTASSKNNAYGITISSCNDMKAVGNNINFEGKDITAFSIFGTVNLSLLNNTIKLNGVNAAATELYMANVTDIKYNNISIVASAKDKAAIVLNMTGQTIIKDNIISTTAENTVAMDKFSTENVVESNTLYANTFIGDMSVDLANSSNKIQYNKPSEIITYYYLNEETFNKFFNDDGTLKDVVPDTAVILVTGNLNDKVMNITKPVTLVFEKTILENSKVIVSADATTITGIEAKDTQIIINANKTNLEVVTLDITTDITDAIIVNGDNNNIDIKSINMQTTNLANATAITLTSKLNNIVVDNVEAAGYDKFTVLKLINSNNNTIEMKNRLSLKAEDLRVIELTNSSYNTFNLNIINEQTPTTEKVIVFNDNSNNNMIVDSTIISKVNGAPVVIENSCNNIISDSTITTSAANSAIVIENSNNNTVYNSTIKAQSYEGAAIDVINSADNSIRYNFIVSKTLKGNDAVVVSEGMTNTIEFNRAADGKNVTITFDVPESVKALGKITINANFQNPDDSWWNPSMIPTDSGRATFMVNGKVIGSVDVIDGKASIVYELTSDDINTLDISVLYEDETLARNIALENTEVAVEKLTPKIITSDVVNDGSTSTIISMVVDELGNIIEDGKITYKINGKTVGTVHIINGIAQFTFDTSNYSLKDYTITTVFGGNDLNAKAEANATLTIVKYDVEVTVVDVVASNGANVTLKAYVNDENGYAVNAGRVSFKLNGKTLKDAEGNTLYADVVGGVAQLNYMVPADMRAKDYTITAVACDKKYNTQSANATLTVNKATPKIDVESTVYNKTENTNMTLNIKITDDNDNNVVGNTNIAVKLNGKTVSNSAVAENGVAVVVIDISGNNAGVYDLSIVTGANKLYNSASMTDVLLIQE